MSYISKPFQPIREPESDLAVVDFYYLNKQLKYLCYYFLGEIKIVRLSDNYLDNKAYEDGFWNDLRFAKHRIVYDPFDIHDLKGKRVINLHTVLFKYKSFLSIGGEEIKNISNPSLSYLSKLLGLDTDLFDFRDFSEDPPKDLLLKHFEDYVNVVCSLVCELEKQCEGWKKYLKDWQIERGYHLFYPISKYVTSVLENYDVKIKKIPIKLRPFNRGGFVLTPTKEFVSKDDGDIYVLDWSSMYPSIIIGLNAFEQIGESGKIDGFLELYGKYSFRESSGSKLLRSLYKQKELGDKTAKIILNSIYGLLSSSFSKFYNPTAAADVTLVGRFITITTIQFLNKLGYEVFYSDSDSYFVLDRSRNKQKIKDVVSFLEDWFSGLFNNRFKTKLKIDDNVKAIRFFEGPNGKLNKKMYVVEYEDGGVEFKGLSIKSLSPINKKVLNLLARDVLRKGGVLKKDVLEIYSKSDLTEFITRVFVPEPKDGFQFGYHNVFYTFEGVEIEGKIVKPASEVKSKKELDLKQYYSEIQSMILPSDTLFSFL